VALVHLTTFIIDNSIPFMIAALPLNFYFVSHLAS